MLRIREIILAAYSEDAGVQCKNIAVFVPEVKGGKKLIWNEKPVLANVSLRVFPHFVCRYGVRVNLHTKKKIKKKE